MNKFITTEANLAPAGWKKPDHIVAAIKKRSKDRAMTSRDARGRFIKKKR